MSAPVPEVLPPAPPVSVIIPAHDAARTLAPCVSAVLASDYPHLEVIVVDDGSTDGTAAVASQLGAVRVLSQRQQGAAAARNAGARVARGHYLYFLDADVVIGRDTIRRLVETARHHAVDLVLARYCTRPRNAGLGPHYKALADYVLYVPRHLRGTVYVDGQIGGGGDFVTRAAFEALGGYDARFRGAGVEREEFYIRFYEAGYHSAANPTITTRHEFPALRRLPRIYASRIHGTVRLLSTRRPPFTYIQRRLLAAGCLAAMALVAAVVTAPLVTRPELTITAGLALFLLVCRDFFAEAVRRKGWAMALAFIPVHATMLLTIGASAAISMAVVHAGRLVRAGHVNVAKGAENP